MSPPSNCFVRRSIFISICVVVFALVLVPTLVRALQHLDPYQPIRTSIRLNWNGDAPPTRTDVVRGMALHKLIGPVVSMEPASTRSQAAGRAHAVDEMVPRRPFVGRDDPLRGPPSAHFL